MAKNSLEFFLALDSTRFNKALSASAVKVSQASKKMANGVKPAVDAFGRLSKTIAGIGTAAAAAAGAAGLYALNSALRESVQLANDQEAAEAKLEAVVKATGEAAGMSAQAMKDYASELQGVTTYGDEVTISAMAVLATFKRIGGEEFRRAIKASQDMATVMGTDLNSAVLQLGKALNDPIKGISALSRAGVQFTDQQKEQIKVLQESGQLVKAQGVILKELEGQFGGVATAARTKFGGAVTAAKNALGDLYEEVGFAITKNPAFIAGIKAVEERFVAWGKLIGENRKELQLAMTTGVSGILRFAAVSARAVGGILDGVSGMIKGYNQANIAVLKMTNGLLYYQQKIAALKGDEETVNRLRRERLDIAYDIAQAEENIADAEQDPDKYRQMAEAAAKELEKLQAIVDNTDMDQSAAAVEGARKIETELREVGGVWINVTKESSDEVNKELSSGMDDAVETVNKAGGTMYDDWSDFFDDMERDTSDSVSNIIKELERLQAAAAATSSSTAAAAGYQNGGGVKRYASGGKLPGYGGGDRVPALLEAGEFIIRKEAVSRFGAGLFSALNSLRLPSLPKFATGGMVAAGAGETVNINLTMPGAAGPVGLSGSRGAAEQLLRDVARMKRLRS